VKNGLNRVVLLGDGIPNHLNGIDYATQAAAADGIAITTLGLGLDYDEMLMGKIAQRTGGRFKYIDEPEKVAGFFRDELQRIDAVYARHATAHLTAGPGVQIERVVGGHGSGSQAHVTLGDIARGDTRDVIVRLTVKPRKAGVPIELLDVQIRFEDAVADAGRIERRVYLGAHTVEEEVLVEKARKPEIELAAALAEAAASTMLALETSKQGFNVRARQMLEKASEAALAQTKRTPSKELEKHAADMLAVAKDLPSADAPPPPLPAKKPEEMQLGDDSLSAPLETPMPTLEVPLPPESSRRIKQMHQQSIDYFQPAPSK
jgi:Ca-activated chloride channel family protein